LLSFNEGRSGRHREKALVTVAIFLGLYGEIATPPRGGLQLWQDRDCFFGSFWQGP